MSENEKQKQPDQNAVDHLAVRNNPQPTRRRLLKSTVAIPVIMTLHSGAALARTSNLVGPVTNVVDAAKDGDGNLYCVHPDTDGDINSEPADLGTSPSATVSQTKDGEGNPIAPNLNDQMEACQRANGILVSANAWTQSIGAMIGGNIDYL